MSDPTIFILGLFVSILTVLAVFLIGVSEGRDPAHSGAGKDVVRGAAPAAREVPVAANGVQAT